MTPDSPTKSRLQSILGHFKTLVAKPARHPVGQRPNADTRRKVREDLARDALWILSVCDALGLTFSRVPLRRYMDLRIAKADALCDGRTQHRPYHLPHLSDVLGMADGLVEALDLEASTADVQIYRVMDVYDTDHYGRPLPPWTRELYFLSPPIAAFTDEEVRLLPLAETEQDGRVIAGLLTRIYALTGRATTDEFDRFVMRGVRIEAAGEAGVTR